MSISKTEMRNPESMNMDKMSSAEMASLIIRANYDAVRACETAINEISRAIDEIAHAFEKGHRLIYMGAGTSGRLGVLDASECPPTFGVPYGQVVGIIAGGKERMFTAGENAEDISEMGVSDLRKIELTAGDVVVGISASGCAAYIIGGLKYARALGCTTVGIANNPDTEVLKVADIPIFLDTGAEVLTGSTRLKAGTAQKIVLNALSTSAMAKTGKIYENMMINLSPSNEKLRRRVVRIVSEILDCNEAEATSRLESNDWIIRKTIERK